MLPDVEDVCLTDVIVRHGAAQVLLTMLDISFAVKYLNEVVVAVIGHLEVVFRELKVDVFPLLSPDDPGAVHRDGVGPGVVHLLAGDVGASYEVHGTTIFKFAFRNIWNDLQWVPNKVIHGFEPTVLDGAVRHEPVDEDDEKLEVRCEGLPQP